MQSRDTGIGRTIRFASMSLLALLPGPLPAGRPTTDTTATRFITPPASARPWIRWWWPGAAVDDGELIREIDLLNHAGFGGAEVQAFNPGIPNLSPAQRAEVDQYARPPFFAHIRQAAAAAATRGFGLDYTFGSAWPSGGGFAITPELALGELTMAATTVDGGKTAPLQVAIPVRSRKLGAFNSLDPRSRDPRASDWKARFDARGKIVAVIALRGTAPLLQPNKPGGFALFPWQDVTKPGELDQASAIVLTDKLMADGTLDWSPPPGRWQVLVFKQYAVNMGILAGAGEGPQLILDHFRRAAFEAHAKRVGDPLIAALPQGHPGLRATFVDSLELMSDLYWSDDFLAQFRARRGYDLTPYLGYVLQPGWMQPWGEHWSAPYYDAVGIGERVRADYRRTVSDLLIENFIQPFVDWNRRNGTLARFQAHGAPVDTLKAYGLADIPETEDLAGADPYFMRLARSAADLYGRPIISAESLCWSGRPYSVTPAELRRRADLIFASGVNQLVIHGMPYAFQRETWPGWHPFAPTAFGPGFSSFLSETNPIWPAVPRLTRYIARMQSVLQAGRSVVPVALFLGDIGYYHGMEDGGAGTNAPERALLAGGYDYDRINEDSLSRAKVANGQLITSGGAHFSALVLPPRAAIGAEAAERLAQFARAGLPVFFLEKAPMRDTGLLDHAARDARVDRAIAQVRSSGGRILPTSDLASALRTRRVQGNLRFLDGGGGLLFVHRIVGKRQFYFLHNPGDAPRDASFVTAARGVVTRWDALDGRIEAQPADVTRAGTQVDLQLAAGASALIAIGPPMPATRDPADAAFAEQSLSGDWQVSATGHGPSGMAVRQDVRLPALSDWSAVPGLEHFSGEARYARTVEVPSNWLARTIRVTLDLGSLHDMATVEVNGHPLPALIGPPWTVDLTGRLRAGTNRLVVTVANTPDNAMIDAKKPGFKDMKPAPAGLVGPVILRASRAMRY